ncbi:MAG: single-stranded-DNA-specific exonuclease RecJ [Phycisphaeraceae bacterium]|nr:single-stranded-DNA-specific exonuclease RecJ [Phycisphaeraceae bacterium]MCW5753416.1 single-stranded-DNA-specific exonuclease RecJ [Phycisphaeraceae bacterium]
MEDYSGTGTVRGLKRLWRPRGSAETGTLVDRVLTARGIRSAEAVSAFLNPTLTGLHDPSDMPDMDRAAARILHAVENIEPIVIYADYDVDGATASAILHHTLHAIRPDVRLSIYVPHRLEEGYGLNIEAVRQLGMQGAKVIVSVDCGVTAVAPALEARQAGIDLIVTDHHAPPGRVEDLPEAYAVVHPRRPDSTYPFGELSGAGVAYKLAWRLATMHCRSERVSPELRATLINMLALAALGTVADVVPLVGENRILARAGLSRIQNSPIEGLRALVLASRLSEKEHVDAEDVGFRLAPRLNACGRMGHARDTIELLTTAKGERAETLAAQLSRQNDHRRSVERTIFAQAMELAEQHGQTGSERRAIVLGHSQWHQGVVGIVCSRLVERFCRPSILLCRNGDEYHGSGRSLEGFSLHGALQACAEHLERFGGHEMAAGLAVRADRLDAFTEAFIDTVNARLRPEDLIRPLEYDACIALHELSPSVVRELERLEPFGSGNPPVRLRSSGLRLTQDATPFGNAGAHLSVFARTARGSAMRLVGWNWAEHREHLRAGQTVEVIVEPKINAWNGMSRVEPVLCDLRMTTS